MPAVFVNMGTVLAGSLLGLLLGGRLKEKYQSALMTALGLCTVVVGVTSAIRSADILCVIICIVLGTALGELLRIDDGIENAGDFLKRKVLRGKAGESRFTEGFVSACILFCVGSMTIMGSLEAGINHNYSIIYAKSALDFVSSMAYAAAMGIGVSFSIIFIFVFQGGLTMLAALVGGALSQSVVAEMTAVGGTILLGMAINMLGLGKTRIRVANMMPAIFLPILYFPVYHLLTGLFA